jgi:hypothetical protein
MQRYFLPVVVAMAELYREQAKRESALGNQSHPGPARRADALPELKAEAHAC